MGLARGQKTQADIRLDRVIRARRLFHNYAEKPGLPADRVRHQA